MDLKLPLLASSLLLIHPAVETFAQSVFINELSVCNISNELDPNYDYSGWIELYNATNADIDLKNLYYSDEEGKPLKYTLGESRILPAKGFALIWLNDEVKNTDGLFLDADAEGGILSIADKSGNLLDKIAFTQQYTNVSYGRTSDGGNSFGYFLTSSCSKSNNGIATATKVVAEPTFSLTGGFYSGPVSVSIDCKTTGAKVYYTLDGSYPTPEKTLYAGTPIVIDKTTPLRAKAYADGFLEGTIATATYMINERQPDLPVFFVTTDEVNLYDDMIGIYCVGKNGTIAGGVNTPCNYNRDWTRPAHLEFLNKEKNPQLDQAIGIEISGNATRHYNQKSFKLKAGKKYGNNRLDYSFFPDKDGRRYKSILLRNGGQDNSKGEIKDGFLQTTASILKVDYQAYEPAVMYLNGKYWGLMNIRERHGRDYLYSNYAYGKTDVDIIENSWLELVNTGNMKSYEAMQNLVQTGDMTQKSVYEQVKSMVDIESYINYMATEIFIGNTDWPNNNQELFCAKENGRWKWMLQDLDAGYKENTNLNKLKEIIESTNTKFSVKMITFLLKNEEFKEQYINTQCLVAGSVFNPTRTNKILETILSKTDAEYPFQAERWGFTDPRHNWLRENVEGLKTKTTLLCEAAFANLQTNFGLGELLNLDISATEPNTLVSFNGLDIPALPYNGKYFKSKEVKLTTTPYANGKKFAYWSITKNGEESKVTESTLTLTPNSETVVRAVYEKSQLVRRKGLYINELSAGNIIFADNSFKYEDWVEIYNSSDKAINLAGYYMSDDDAELNKFRFESIDEKATTIPAFGYGIVWCSKKPERGVMHTNFKLANENAKVILSRDNKGAIEVVDSISYSEHSDYVSYGRYPDGGTQICLFESPTFKKRNEFSFYNTPQYIQSEVLVSKEMLTEAMGHIRVYTDAERQHLTIENPRGTEVRVSLIQTNGITLRSYSVLENRLTIDISDLSSGIYIACLSDGTMTKSVKFIK